MNRTETPPDTTTIRQLQESRILLLQSEVTEAAANELCAQLLLLAAVDSNRDIHLYINSPGGSVSAGMAIYDTMSFVRPDVATVAIGFAASIGQFLLASGATGKRFALPHARIVMRQPRGGFGGGTADIEVQAEQIIAMKGEIAALTADQTGRSIDEIERDQERDRWFTADEARDYGFIDRVIDEPSALRG